MCHSLWKSNLCDEEIFLFLSVRQWSVSSPLPLSRERGLPSKSDLAVPWGFWGSSPGPPTSPVLARRWRVRLREVGIQLGDSRPQIRAGGACWSLRSPHRGRAWFVDEGQGIWAGCPGEEASAWHGSCPAGLCPCSRPRGQVGGESGQWP